MSCKLKREGSDYTDVPATAVNCDLLWIVVGCGVLLCGKYHKVKPEKLK